MKILRMSLKKKTVGINTPYGYFLIYYEGICPTHTFLTYEKNNKCYWVEHAWEKFAGIHEYKSIEELIRDVRNKYIEYELEDDFDNKNLAIYEYKKPKFHISAKEFVDYCTSFKKI